MSKPLDNKRYASIAVALHWAIAILILGQIAGGLYMHNLPNASPVKFDLYQLHKSFGLSVLILTFLRLGWRLVNPPPALPVAMPGWQKLAARATHWGFYALMFITPLAGLAIVSVSPTDIPTKWFGVVHVPHLPFFNGVADRAAVEDIFKEVHEVLAFSILFLLVLHVGAALKHGFINRDGVLRSMAPAGAGQLFGVAAILGALGAGALFYLFAPAPAPDVVGVESSTVAPGTSESELIASSTDASGSNPTSISPTPSAAASISTDTDNSRADISWAVDYEASRLAFIGEEKGQRFEGALSDYRVAINFDPENLGASNFRVDVATSSISTGDSLRDSTIPGKEWFDANTHPTATFTADDIRSTGENEYEAIGTLQIKEFERPVTVVFTLTADDDKTIATGSADLVRTDFGLGLNDSWLSEEGVALEVRIDFEIEAARAP